MIKSVVKLKKATKAMASGAVALAVSSFDKCPISSFDTSIA